MAELDAGLALVVGGASGIGAACVRSLAADGWRVLVADRIPVAQSAANGSAGWIPLDVRDRKGVNDAFADVRKEHAHLDVVVYAAGTARVTPILEIEEREWELVRSVNLDGAFHVLQAGARAMLGGGGGAIVLISSIDAASPVDGLAHYCAAKAAVEALARSAALELGEYGIRVNALAPGVVRTPLMAEQLADPGVERAFLERIPCGGIGEPADVAGAVAFLASDAASWITGATIPVDGGMRLRGHPKLLLTTTPNQENQIP
jgi:NAD(P)-dependent dehydrogenase (short-subunit alcohol dehydrogenase family)